MLLHNALVSSWPPPGELFKSTGNIHAHVDGGQLRHHQGDLGTLYFPETRHMATLRIDLSAKQGVHTPMSYKLLPLQHLTVHR